MSESHPMILPSNHVTMPTREQLAELGIDESVPAYPQVEIDGVRFAGLRDEIIDAVPEWAGRADLVKALCRKAQADAALAEIAAQATARLAVTDHWALKAVETGEPVAPARRAYRDALRAIVKDPAGFSAWPVKP